ncbi:NAD(P)-binding protein [Schizophyllum commune H4-8]|uniref:NAD(P)-binding protein n=1 Tax=Schizophyllum commune (strain H4-8 / FGSC 9210) TaxID=578458 RepID=UPI002160A36A|nr:NAD(P)-binding protein [Schizophyllum commune H4-8]KAI5886630.1 NAD(P)-binding protein [Schizophyllum commune H4-8]
MASILKSKCVLVTGATAGIGRALARAIRDLPSKPTVIAMGRRQERLDELAKEGFKTAKFDMNTTPDKIRAFVDDITAQYPELDAVILNAGVQYIFDFTKPESVDFNKISTEFNVNYLAVVSMMTAFLPHLIKIGKERPTLLVPVTSGLMTIPLPSTANYSATKAALHSISFSIRIQMENAKTNVHVLEIIPPLVESELHDNQGTTEALSRFWMPLADFINVVLDGLKEGKIAITAGAATSAYLQFEKGKESYRNGLMGLPVTQ